MRTKIAFPGILAFFIVLLAMPLGHAAMIIMEKIFGQESIFPAAAILGFVGVGMLLVGVFTKNDTPATFWGLFGGLFVWTGWIEFAFVYYAHRYGVSPLMENGVVVTKPEYLIMPSSIGFWAVFMLYYFFGTKTGCCFFSWFQNKLKVGNKIELKSGTNRNIALVTFVELNMLLWTFYLVLLLAYDKHFFGDHHPVTYCIAFGSLLWSLILFLKLIKIKHLGYAIRYAIPTVIIFWNFVEILGRWNFFKVIWIYPSHYWLEIILLFAVFVALIIISITGRKIMNRTDSQHLGERPKESPKA